MESTKEALAKVVDNEKKLAADLKKAETHEVAAKHTEIKLAAEPKKATKIVPDLKKSESKIKETPVKARAPVKDLIATDKKRVESTKEALAEVVENEKKLATISKKAETHEVAAKHTEIKLAADPKKATKIVPDLKKSVSKKEVVKAVASKAKPATDVQMAEKTMTAPDSKKEVAEKAESTKAKAAALDVVQNAGKNEKKASAKIEKVVQKASLFHENVARELINPDGEDAIVQVSIYVRANANIPEHFNFKLYDSKTNVVHAERKNIEALGEKVYVVGVPEGDYSIEATDNEGRIMGTNPGKFEVYANERKILDGATVKADGAMQEYNLSY